MSAKSWMVLLFVLPLVFLGCSDDEADQEPAPLGPAPSVASVSPSTLGCTESTLVTIIGSDFEEGAAVFVGDESASLVTVLNATTITAFVSCPGGTAGSYDLRVQNPDGQSGTLTAALTFTGAPTVTGISPYGGPLAAGTAVTVTGTDFQAGAIVLIGGNPATNVVFVSATSITCDTPASPNPAPVGGSELAAVKVINPDNQSGQLYDGAATNAENRGFLYAEAPAAIVTYNEDLFDYARGRQSGANTIRIEGNYLQGTATGAPGEPTVTFNGLAATNYDYTNMPTSFTCENPDNTTSGAGDVSVVVTNPDSQTGTGTFHYNEFPEITAIAFDDGSPGPVIAGDTGGRRIEITGNNFFEDAAHPPTISVNGQAAANVTWVDVNTVEFDAPAQDLSSEPSLPVYYDVVITNPDTQTDTWGPSTSDTGLGYDEGPTITNVSVTTAPYDVVSSGAPYTVITGDHFSGTVRVWIGSVELTDAGPNQFDVIDVNTINILQIPISTETSVIGPVEIRVRNGSDLEVTYPVTATTPFTYISSPTITNIAPRQGVRSGSVSVTITGTDFFNGATVTFGSGSPITPDSITGGAGAGPHTTITVTTAADSWGGVDVTVTNIDGETATEQFTTQNVDGYFNLSEPAITGIAPDPGASGSTITITGTDFFTGASVTIDGTSATGVTVASQTSITCTVPVLTNIGSVNVVVSNADGQSSAPYSWTYQSTPTITNVSPSDGISGTTITVDGTEFYAGLTVYINDGTNDYACSNITLVNQTQVTADVPVCSTVGGAGTYYVRVTNSDSQTAITPATAFRYLPNPDGLSPTGGMPSGGTLVTVSASDGSFLNGATISLGGTPMTVTFVSATELTFTTPPGTGANDMVVTNPAPTGGVCPTPYLQFTYANPPAITGINPVNGPQSISSSVTISGTDFSTTAVVYFGNTVTAGRASFTNGSTTVTGIGTSWTSAMDGWSIRLDGGVSYTISSVTNATTLELTGAFGGTTATGYYTAFEYEAASYSSRTATSIVCNTPVVGTSGAYTVTVKNPDSQNDTTSYTFDPAPDATSVTPNNGPANYAPAYSITITGTNFDTTNGCTVTIGGLPCSSVVVGSATSITCDIPATLAASAHNLVVTNLGDSQPDPTPITFTAYNPPNPTSATPIPEDRGGATGLLVTITGTDFQTGATVTIGGTAATTVTVVSATSITCYVPARTAAQGPGEEDIVVTNPLPSVANTGTLTDGMTYRKVLTWYLEDRSDFAQETLNNVDETSTPGDLELTTGQTTGTFTINPVDGELLPTARRDERALPDRVTLSVDFYHPNTTTDADTFLVGGAYGAALTTDGGTTFKTWTESTGGDPAPITRASLRHNRLTAVSVFSGDATPNVFILGGRLRGAVLTTDGGSTWAHQYDNPAVGSDPLLPYPADGVQDIDFYHAGRVGGNFIFMIATRTALNSGEGTGLSADSGANWSWGSPYGDTSMGAFGYDDSGDTRGVSFFSGGNNGARFMIACRVTPTGNADEGQCSRTENSGGGWWFTRKPAPLTDGAGDHHAVKIECCDQDWDTWAAGSNNRGAVWTDDNGGSYTQFNTGNGRLPSNDVRNIEFYNGTAGQDGAHMLISTAAGLVFTPNATNPNPTVFQYHSTSTPALPSDVVNDAAYYSGNNGNTQIWLVATDGGLRLTTDGADSGASTFNPFRGGPLVGGSYPAGCYITNYNWLTVSQTVGASQSITYQILDSTGTALPDTVFSSAHQSTYGLNSTGLTLDSNNQIDLYEIDVTTYWPIRIQATLTDSGGGSPSIQTIEVSFVYANPN